MTPTYISGLDLGQAADYSALVVVEKSFRPDPDRPAVSLPHFGVRHLHRWPLQTPYPVVVADVKELFSIPPLRDSALVIDKTGVGAAVSDIFRFAGVTADLRPFQITHGFTPGDGTVPKQDLVSAGQATLQDRRLQFAAALPLTPVLAAELENFRVKVTEDRNETFSAWREHDNDDLVLVPALAVWYGRPHECGWDYTQPVITADPLAGIAAFRGQKVGSATGW